MAGPRRGLRSRGALIGSTVVALAVAGTGVPANPSQAHAAQADSSAAAAMRDRYVVVFVEGTSLDHVTEVRAAVIEAGGSVHHDYDAAFRGFAATLPAPALGIVQDDPEVLVIEPDHQVEVGATQPDPPNWGLDRVDQRPGGLNRRYDYVAGGAGVRVYVIDTGIRASHQEFSGRVSGGVSTVEGSPGVDDCNGHGTHTAAIAAGTTYGVAKHATIVPVRVLGCAGTGSASDLIEGIDWVTAHARDNPGPAVANMSLGDQPSMTIDLAVQNSIAEGTTYAVAAGNTGGNACHRSPARVPQAMTVGATTVSDTRASFSNYGTCVDLWAPGASIRSAYQGGDSASRVMSGTSMASPHVAGVAALYLQSNPTATPAQVRTALVSGATAGVLSGIRSGSPNRLLYSAGVAQVDNRGPTTAAPQLRLTGGRVGAAGAAPVRVLLSGFRDLDGHRLARRQLQVSRDGGAHWSVVALPAPRATGVSLHLAGSDRLRLRSRVTDTGGAVGPWAATATHRLRLRDQGAADFGPARRWRGEGRRTFYGGAARYASARAARAIFRFSGRQVAWVGTRSPWRGKAAVYLDGHLVATVNLYRVSSSTRRVLFRHTGLAAGGHTLRIVVLGAKHRRAGSTRVDVDAFVTLR